MRHLAQATTQSIFGQVSPPPGVAAYDTKSGGSIGLIAFISTMIQAFTVIAGLFVLMQILLARWTYITANGDSAAHGKVRERLTMSIIGIMIIVASYTVAGIIGFIFFGDASFIINPNFQGP